MRYTRRITHILIAAVLIIIGICGLVLPVLNGVIFLLLGVILLSFESPYIEYHLQKLVQRNETAEKWYKKLDTWMRKIFT